MLLVEDKSARSKEEIYEEIQKFCINVNYEYPELLYVFIASVRD